MEQERLTSRIDDPSFIEAIRKQFAEEWDELITGPGSYSEDELTYGDKILRGEKVPRTHRWLDQKLVRIGQDQRLTPDEIDKLRELFLE